MSYPLRMDDGTVPRRPRIRRARAGEAAALSALAFASKAHWGYPAAVLERWRAELTVTPAELVALEAWVAEVDGRAAGFAVLEPGRPHATLQHLWVAPERIGTGIGRALMGQVLRRAHRLGARALEVDADPNAEPFYVACGGRRIGTLAAPIDGAPGRVRPQLLLPVAPPPRVRQST